MEILENEQRESMKQLKDFIVDKQHPCLVLNRGPWDESKETPCSACQDLLSGESYNCAECDFHIHKRCAEAPFKIEHPLHRTHHLTLQASRAANHKCFICSERDLILGYGCSSCGIFIDFACAISTFDETVLDHIHEHPLIQIGDRLCDTPYKGIIVTFVKRDCQILDMFVQLAHFVLIRNVLNGLLK